MENSNKNVKIISQPYVYEDAFKTVDGNLINYSQLCVDVMVGNTKVKLVHKLRGFETEYIKTLISADNAFGGSDE